MAQDPNDDNTDNFGLGHNGGPVLDQGADINIASTFFEGLSEREIRRWFSPLLSQIESCIGFAMTLKLVEELGGREVYFPLKPSGAGRRSRVIKAVGLEAAEKLSHEFGNMKIGIPPGPFSGPGARRRRGIAMLENGASLNDVAFALRCSRSTAQAWKRQIERPNRSLG